MTELIGAIDVGTTKICALIGMLDDSQNLRVIGAGRVASAGLRRAVVVNASEATAAIGQAVADAELSADQSMESAYVGISGTHVNALGSKGVTAVGRSGRSITKEDVQRALEQARNIALPHNRDFIHTVPRTYCVDDQQGILDPIGMFGYRLEVDASIITGASSAITNLVQCVRANNVAIDDLVLEPLASAEAALTDDERQLGVALVDIGGGTTDLAVYLDGAPWHTRILEIGGDHMVRDVAAGLRMPYGKAEALIKQYGHALPSSVPPDAEVRSGAFGQEGHQIINRKELVMIINARAEEVIDLILREIKRSGYDGLLPAGIVFTGGVAQLPGFAELSREQLGLPVRIGHPQGVFSSVIDLGSPEYATSVGLLLWALRQGTASRISEPPPPSVSSKIVEWLRKLLPIN